MISFLYRCLQIIRNVRVRWVDLWQSDKSLRIFSAILQKNFKFLLGRWRKQFFSIYALSWHHSVVLLFVCVCHKTNFFFYFEKRTEKKKKTKSSSFSHKYKCLGVVALDVSLKDLIKSLLFHCWCWFVSLFTNINPFQHW